MPPNTQSDGAGRSASSASVHANIERRASQMEQRKRQLLLEARRNRIEWVLDDSNTAAKVEETEWDGTTNPLKNLQACTSNILPNAPEIIQGLLVSKCDWVDCSDDTITSKIASNVKAAMDKEKLQWTSISKLPTTNNNSQSTIENDIAGMKISDANHQELNLTPIPPPVTYDKFLRVLCDPSAADIVISIQNFCKTVKEAARVMIALQEETKVDRKDVITGTAPSSTNNNTTNNSALKQKLSVQNHSLSLVKALRGFVNSTIRDIEKHSAFVAFLSGLEGTMNGNIGQENDNDAKDRLVECLEKFLYTKCRRDIDLVLSWEVEPRDDEHYHTLRGSVKKEQNPLSDLGKVTVDKLVKESEDEMYEKLKSLQFVSPRHLEIKCLEEAQIDIDLSYPMQQLLSLNAQSSPRQMLQTILLIFRGINVALNSAVAGRQTPPGADDVLPTLILTVLRANPPRLLTNILFIERFAPVSLLRGEAGYAYTNLCGAVQFLKDLNVDEHMADVSMGEGAVLSIDPAEFRAGLEKCRMMMEADEDEKISVSTNNVGLKPTNNSSVVGKAQFCEESSALFDMNITASDVRHARSAGCTTDLDWALEKQKALMWKEGKVRTKYNNQEVTTDGAGNHVAFLPPEEPPLPSNFSRSYSYLATAPNDIRMSDLPNLLKEYRMLVHATESLLNERQTWRESERKRLLQMEREKLEKTYDDVIGKSS